MTKTKTMSVTLRVRRTGGLGQVDCHDTAKIATGAIGHKDRPRVMGSLGARVEGKTPTAKTNKGIRHNAPKPKIVTMATQGQDPDICHD